MRKNTEGGRYLQPSMPEDRLGEVSLQQKGGAGSCPWGADGYGMSRVLDLVSSWKGVYV